MKLKAPGYYEITGLAWSGAGKVRAVDVSVDGGRNWREATLEEPIMDKCLTRFKVGWNWDGKPAVLMSRAVDSTGSCSRAWRRSRSGARSSASCSTTTASSRGP